jgi:hypothetical protein
MQHNSNKVHYMNQRFVGCVFRSPDKKKLYHVVSQLDRVHYLVEIHESINNPFKEVWPTSRFNGYKIYNSIAELRSAEISGGKPVSSEGGTVGAK